MPRLMEQTCVSPRAMARRSSPSGSNPGTARARRPGCGSRCRPCLAGIPSYTCIMAILRQPRLRMAKPRSKPMMASKIMRSAVAPKGDLTNPGEWARYAGNPVLQGTAGTWDGSGATFASVISDTIAGEYRMYYHGWGDRLYGHLHRPGDQHEWHHLDQVCREPGDEHPPPAPGMPAGCASRWCGKKGRTITI